jgi:serine/threonine-protein kinase
MESIASMLGDAEVEDDSWESLAYRQHGLEILRKLAEGGEGEVYAAVQSSVDRKVAVKILKEDLQEKLGGAERFLEGARIGARLQHPGIVPVYDVGRIGSRPFFTMRLLGEGRRFADVLASRPRPSQGDLLAIYVHVCQTLAYAHEQGIVHLDLKPSNVMVGEYGEVLVIDWGLAKQKDSWPGPERWIRWTPSYAAPEQLSGEAEQLDPRCDVFSLGAILCEILTGRPPYEAADSGDGPEEIPTCLAECRGRLEDSKADPELIALAISCLDRDPDRRPRNAAEVARRIEEYQASEEARHERNKMARWKAEERARWILIGSVAALALIASGAFAWGYGRVQQARAEAVVGREIEELLAKADLDLSQGNILDAQAKSEKAAGRLDALSEPLRRAFDSRVSDIGMRARLWRVRHPALTEEGSNRNQQARVARGYEAAFLAYGIDVRDPAKAADLIKKSAIQNELVVGLDDWAEATVDQGERDRLRAFADLVDPDPAGPLARIRLAKRGRDIAALKRLATTAEVLALPPQVLASLSVWLCNADALTEAIALLREAWKLHPGDYWINVELGIDLALAAGTAAEAAEANAYLTASLALGNRSPLPYVYLGIKEYDLGIRRRELPRFARSAEAYHKAIEIDPRHALAYSNLGNSLMALNSRPQAEAAYRKAIELDPGLASPHYNLGVLHDEGRRIQEAAAEYRESIRLQPDFFRAYINLAGDEFDLGEFGASASDYRRGLDRMSARAPERPLYEAQAKLAAALAAVGPQLDDVRSGKARPTNAAEAIDFARLCVHPTKQEYRLAAKLFHQAFRERPELANDRVLGDRYAAARAAAIAAALPDVGADERVELRGWAIDWLRAELAIRDGEIRGPDAAAREGSRSKLEYWLLDAGFAAVRDDRSIDLLPEPEREPWRKLWGRVRELIAVATPRKTTP